MNFAYFFKRTVYHTALDNVENLDPRSLQHHGLYALALARHFGGLDLNDLQNSGGTDAIFFSFFGAVLVHYPATWAPRLAVLAGLLLVGVIVLGFGRKQLAVPRLALGMLAFLLSLVVAVVLLTVAWWAIDRLHLARQNVVGPTYQAHFYLAGFLALTVAIVGTVHALFRRKAQVANLTVGVLLWWWILALVTSLCLPGFSYLFTWPLLSGLSVQAWILWREPAERSSWRRVAVLTVGAAPGLILLTPVVYGFFQAIGVSSPGFSGSPSFPIISLSIFSWGMLVGLLIPQLELMAGSRTWWLVGVMLLVAVGFVVAGSLAPGIGVEHFGLSNLG